VAVRRRRGRVQARLVPQGQGGGIRGRRAPNAGRSFTPFQAPTRPPTGTYDPVLDAQERASQRGLADLVADTDLNRTRSASDYAVGLGELGRQVGYQRSDMNLGLQRTVADHANAIGGIQRDFRNLGTAQAQQSAAQGVSRGGTVLAAAMKRAENEAITRAPVDLALGRYQQDYGTNMQRLTENEQFQRGQLGSQYQRYGEDLTTGLSRARRETTQFGLDTAESRFFQAQQSGWEAPTRPGAEHRRGPVTYRVRGQGPGRKYTLPNGRVLTRDEWVNLWRYRGATGQLPPGLLNNPFADRLS
jgi:hypothetical protein